MSKEKIRKKTTKSNKQEFQFTSTNGEIINWQKFLEPKSSTDLIVHPKKIEDIKNWLQLAQKTEHNRILLLIGPPGCCKLTTIKILAKEFNYDVIEWTAKLDIDRDLLMDDGEKSYNYKKQSDVFQDFLFKSSRYNSIFSQNDRLLIVKDLPGIFIRKGSEEVFWKILEKFKLVGTSPIVFILTETNSKALNIEYNLFPETVRCKLAIDTINMNPISITMMKKALKQICAQMKENDEKFMEPTQSLIDDIVTQSQGDIRNAIMNLQMVGQQGTLDLSMPTKSSRKLGKNRKEPAEKINKGVGRNEIIGILHGVGRALYPKREENEQTKLMKLTHSPESVADSFYSQPGNYIELLHSNYLKNFTSIEGVGDFTNVLSLSDNFQSEYRNAERLHVLNLNLVIRAAMVCNENPPKGFRPITAYASKKFRKTEEKCLQEYLSQSMRYNGGHRISIRDYFLDYASFLKHIK